MIVSTIIISLPVHTYQSACTVNYIYIILRWGTIYVVHRHIRDTSRHDTHHITYKKISMSESHNLLIKRKIKKGHN